MTRRNIDLLDHVTVPSPCTEDWDSMSGNEQVRFCSHCSSSVHNLSEMTRREAIALVRKSQGRLCVRYYRSPDATVQTLPPHSIKRRVSRLAAGAFTATLSLSASALAQTPTTAEPSRSESAQIVSGRDTAVPDVQTGPQVGLSGTVVDPQEAVVPGAAVTLVDEKTQQEYTTRTDDEGVFQFQALPAGSYKLKAESPGFLTKEIDGLALQPNEERRLALALEIGGALGGAMVIVSLPVDAVVNAAFLNDLPKVKELIAAGMDVNVVDSETNVTALMEAVGNGNQEMVRVLLNAGADVNARNKNGRTALLNIHEDTTAEVVWALVAAGAKVNRKDVGGNTPVLMAAMEDNVPVLQALLDAGAKVNAKNEEGRTALMEAAREDHSESVKVLLRAGADVDRKDNEGRTALKLAQEAENSEIIKLLEGYGAR
jgi:hypothetical protein